MRVLRAAATLSYAIIVLAGGAQVLTRFVLKISLSWSVEVIRYTFIWSVFLTAALLLKDNAHIRVDFFSERFSGRVRSVFGLLSDVLAVVFLGVLLLAGTRLTISAAAIGSRSPAMEISMALPYAAIPVGSAVMLWFQGQRIWRQWIVRRKGPE